MLVTKWNKVHALKPVLRGIQGPDLELMWLLVVVETTVLRETEICIPEQSAPILLYNFGSYNMHLKIFREVKMRQYYNSSNCCCLDTH